MDGRNVRSRTSSTSSLRSPSNHRYVTRFAFFGEGMGIIKSNVALVLKSRFEFMERVTLH